MIKIKLTLVVVILGLSGLHARVWSQEERLNLEFQQMTLARFFEFLQEKTDLRFVYSQEDLKQYTVEGPMRSMSVEEVLDLVFSDKPLKYQRLGEHIVISKATPQQQTQTINIKGAVKDEQKRAIPGVTVFIKGTTLGASTDAEGKFSIKLPASKDAVILVFSFIGMEKQEYTYNGEEELAIILKESVQAMEEVVISGIFSRLESTYTGAATVINKKEMQNFGTRDIISTLRNIDPAFNIIESNEWGSDPNRLPELTVRGAAVLPQKPTDLKSDVNRELNTPLILLDGFPISLQQMMDMDVNEMETVTLLKDAAATAQYGSRGTNGVILITRVLPEPGKLQFSYAGSLNIEMPDLSSYDVLNARDKLELEELSGYFSAPHPTMDFTLKRYLSELLQEVERGVDTDWLSQPVRTGVGHRNRITIGGGDRVFRYSLSASYNSTVGTMKDTERNNFNGAINLTYNAGKFSFVNNFSITVNDGKISSPYGSFNQYVTMNPYYPIYNEEGDMIKQYFYPSEYNPDITTNPMYNTRLHLINTSDYISLSNNFRVEWIPIAGFRATAQLGISYKNDHSDVFKPADHTDFARETDFTKKGSYDYSTGTLRRVDLNLALHYHKLLRKIHLLNFGMQGEMSDEQAKSYNFRAVGFQDEKLDFLPMALHYPENASPGGSESHVRRVSLAVNGQYSLKARYTLNATFRTDGSSQYGNKNRWQYFYSVGFAWNAEKEDFIRELNFFDRLKLRASIGINGATSAGAYDAVATYVYYAGQNYGNWMGSRQTTLDNPDLGWSTTQKNNIGLDITFLRNRVQLMTDVYLHTTDGLIQSMQLPPSSGFAGYTMNAMSTENRGVELKATVAAIRNTRKQIILNISGALTYETDKVKKLSDVYKAQMVALSKQVSPIPNEIIEEGKSRYVIYTVPSLGIDPSNGKELFLKKNGEVTYDWMSNDRVASGVAKSPYRGNLRATFEYKGISLSVSSNFEWGGQYYNSTLIQRVENANKLYNVDRRVFEDRWKKPGDMTFFKGINETTPTYNTSRFVQDKAEFRIGVITLGYNFRESRFLKSAGLRSLTLQGTFNEPCRFSTIKMERGTNYPFARNMSLGINATF